MKRSSISSLLLCVALLTVAPGTLEAQDGEGIIRINGGSMTIALHPNPRKIEQSSEDSSSLVTIYSDLGTGTNVYLPNIGWSVTGPEVAGGKSILRPRSLPSVTSTLFSSRWPSSRPQARMASR
jgi:hypothetical protein